MSVFSQFSLGLDIEPQSQQAVSQPTTVPQWNCTLVVQTNLNVDHIIRSVNAEIYVIVGHLVKNQHCNVMLDNPVMDDSCPEIDNTGVKIYGPMLDLPYYKDIVIYFARKVGQLLRNQNVIVMFESPNQRTLEKDPEWLDEIKPPTDDAQTVDMLNWSLVVKPINNWHWLRQRALTFCTERYNWPFCCSIEEKADGFCELVGTSFPNDGQDPLLIDAVVSLKKYLTVSCLEDGAETTLKFTNVHMCYFPE